jgi:hypothetical protein
MVAPFADDATHQLRELVRTGRFRDALDRYRREEATPAELPADARLLAATAATRLGQYADGSALAEQARVRFGARGDLDGKMRALNLLGVLAFERGHLAEAEEYLAEALRLATHLEDSLIAARACNNLASVLHLRGRPDEAVGLYRAALLSYQRLGDRRGTAETYHNLGLTYRQMAEYPEAEKAVRQAVRHAEFVGEPSLMALTTTGRAELRVDVGEISLAYPELERATWSGWRKSGGCARWPRSARAAPRPRRSRPRPPARRRRPTGSLCCRRSARRSRPWPGGRWGIRVPRLGGRRRRPDLPRWGRPASWRRSRSSGTATPEDDTVDRQVDSQHQRRQDELRPPGEPTRVEDRQEVVAHEIALVGRLARPSPELLLQRRERTDPSGQLDPHSPQRGGKVKPRHPGPAQHQ